MNSPVLSKTSPTLTNANKHEEQSLASLWSGREVSWPPSDFDPIKEGLDLERLEEIQEAVFDCFESNSDQSEEKVELSNNIVELKNLPSFESSLLEVKHHKRHKRGFFGRIGHGLEKGIRHGAHNVEKGIRHGAHDLEKYVRHHKKEVLVVAAVVAAITIIVIAAPAAAPTGAALGGGALATAKGKGNSTNDQKIDLPKEDPPQNTESNKSEWRSMFDKDYHLREECLKEANLRAMEQRYPGSVYSEEKVQNAKAKADVALQQFSRDLSKIVEANDMIKIAEIGLTTKGAKDSKSLWQKVTYSFITSSEGKDLMYKYRDKLTDSYEPVQKALTEYHTMENVNRKASYDRCEAEGYKPNLEFDPKGSNDACLTRFIDKNNPKEHEISVYFP